MAINHQTMFIADIYYLSVNVRDTLNYTMDKYDPSLVNYEARKNRILAAFKPNSPMSNFISQNSVTQNEYTDPQTGEKVMSTMGERIKQQIDNFMAEVYGDDSNIIRKEGDKVVPDMARAIRVFEFVVGIHETLTDIVQGYLKNMQEQKVEIDTNFVELVQLGERFYRSYIYVALITHLVKYFKEYNQAMQESKGAKTPQSNFINADINRIVGFLRFVRDHAKIRDPETLLFMDKTRDTIEIMQGQRQAPEGKTVWQEFEEARNLAATYLNKYAPLWQTKNTTVGTLGREYLEKNAKSQGEA